MATFFSGTYIGYWNTGSNHLVGTLVGDVIRSGNTVTLANMTLSWYPEQTSYGSSDFTFYVNGVGTGKRISPNDSMSLNWVSFGVGDSQTYAEVGWSSSDGYSGVFGVSFPSGITPPTGLNMTDLTRGKDWFEANVSITGWGVGSGTRYRELQVWTYSDSGLVEPRRYQPSYGDSYSGRIRVDNSSVGGNLTLIPNQRYVLGTYATNGQAYAGSQRHDWYTTLADELSAKSAVAIDTHTLRVSYTTKSDGGYYAKEIQYSLDNSTWTTGATVNSGSVTSGTFDIQDLEAGTSYTIYFRVNTYVGYTTSGSITVKTKNPCKIITTNGVVEAKPYIIKPNGTKKELDIRRITNG